MNKTFNKYLNQTNQYRLKLLSDIELENGASIIYNKVSNSNSDTYSLESAMFGMTKTSPCTICGQTKDCTSHYGLISLPYPIVSNLIVEDQFNKLIQIICPHCSNFPIKNAKEALSHRPSDRFGWIQTQVKKLYKNNINSCPYCKQKFIFITVEGKFPSTRYLIKQDSANKLIQLNPLFVYAVINNISNITCEYGGFNKHTNNPRNYMTKFIVIIPNKLRIKTLESASSSITSTYKRITEFVIPELNKYLKTTIGLKKTVVQDEQGLKFNRQYDQLRAYYGLFLDMTKESTTNACLGAIGKHDKKHLDASASMVGRLKDKESSYFEKGIVGTRHQVSARTVLGGGTDIHCYEIGFPEKFCNQMGYMVPVYAENLELVKQFVASMTDVTRHNQTTVRVNRLLKTQYNESNSIKPDRAEFLATRIVPGDKIFVSLLPGSLVMHCRFPSVREESWATHQLVPTQHTIMTLPLAACGFKNADFDGDETGLYANYGWYTDAESLLLHSLYRQMIQYKNGTPGVFFDTDSQYEIPRFNKNMTIGVTQTHDPISDRVVGRHSYFPPRNVLDIIDEYIDEITGHSENTRFTKIPKINYKDSKTVIVENKIDRDRCKMDNKAFYLYLATSIGTERAMNLIDHLVQLGYNSANYHPITLGREIRFYGNEKKIREIHDQTYEEMKKVEQSDISVLHKDAKQYVTAEKQKADIIPLLMEGGKGSNLDNIGLLQKFSNGYYSSMVNMAPIIIDGKRVQATLADYTRTCASFSKYSVDPCAYGYIKHGYMDHNVSPIDTFYDCMLQRKSLYTKGSGVGKQGYLAKRFIMAFGSSVVDANGAICLDEMFISPSYGVGSYNPRYSFELPLIDLSLPDIEFKNKYSPRLVEIRDLIKDARNAYVDLTNFLTYEILTDKFVSGYNFEQFIDNFPQGETSPEIIEELVTFCEKAFSPLGMAQRYSKLNFIFFEYYLRTKLKTAKLTRNQASKIFTKYIDSFVDSGEPVGLKAAVGISEALTQELLDSIHHATGGSVDVNKLQMTKGGDRFGELLGGSTHKAPVMTLGFYDSSEESVRNFAKEQETIYFKNIWTKLETCMSSGISDMVKKLHPNRNFDVGVFKVFVKMIWNLNIIADYDIKLSTIFNTLIEKFPKICFVTGHVLNSKEFMCYIYFHPETSKIDIDRYILSWKSEVTNNIIHGRYLVNCFVTKNKNNNEWVLQANEISPKAKVYEQIIFDPRLDVSKCRTSDTRTNLTSYGVFESVPRLYEEVIYCSNVQSSVGAILNRHYKTICLGCLATSRYFLATANSAEKVGGDYLRRIAFEQPSTFIRKAIEDGSWKPVDDTIAAQTWGELPKAGSGYSKVLIYKN